MFGLTKLRKTSTPRRGTCLNRSAAVPVRRYTKSQSVAYREQGVSLLVLAGLAVDAETRRQARLPVEGVRRLDDLAAAALLLLDCHLPRQSPPLRLVAYVIVIRLRKSSGCMESCAVCPHRTSDFRHLATDCDTVTAQSIHFTVTAHACCPWLQDELAQRLVTFWTGRSLYHLLVQARHHELSPVGLLLFWWYAAAGFISRHRPHTFSATFPWSPSAAAFCTAHRPR